MALEGTVEVENTLPPPGPMATTQDRLNYVAEQQRLEKEAAAKAPETGNGAAQGGEGQTSTDADKDKDKPDPNAIAGDATPATDQNNPEKGADADKDKGADANAAAVVVSDFDKAFAEKTGGKFENFEAFQKHADDLQAKITELETKASTPAEPQYTSEFTKKLDEFVRQGGDVDTFIATQSVNYDSGNGGISPMENIRARMVRAAFDDGYEPDFSEIVNEFEHTYRPQLWMKDYDPGMKGTGTLKTKEDFENDPRYDGDPEKIADAWREAQFLKTKYERDAAKAQRENIEYQKQWAVPPKQQQQVDTEAEAKKRSDAQAAFGSEVAAEVGKLNAIKVVLDDKGDTFEFKPDSKILNDLKDAATGAFDVSLFNRFLDDKGNWQQDKWVEFCLFGLGGKEAAKAASAVAFKKGQLANDKNRRDMDFTPESTATGSKTAGALTSDQIQNMTTQERIAYVQSLNKQ